MVVSMLKAKSDACPPGTSAVQQGPRIARIPAAVLAKEAVYNAAGVGAYDLHDYIDFKQWFQTALLQVCQDMNADHGGCGEKTGAESSDLISIHASACLCIGRGYTYVSSASCSTSHCGLIVSFSPPQNVLQMSHCMVRSGNFKNWWQSALQTSTAVCCVQDMADTSAEAKPVRRRAAMLLGQWAVKLPATERPAAYRSLITLMNEEDAAVQLAAVSMPLSCLRRS